MAMFSHRSDIAFAADDVRRFLPWLIGVMACLVALLLSLGVTLNGWVLSRSDDYTKSFTVNLPADMPGLADKAAGAEARLKALPEVKSVQRVSDASLKSALAAWVGDAPLDALPLPTVFEVTLKDAGSPPDYDALQKEMAALAPGAEVDAHERWAAAFSAFAATVQIVLLLLAALLLGAMAAMISFTARAALKLHKTTVALLHSIGAEDRYIARQFQREAVRLAFPGALFGALAAGVIYWGMGLYMASLPLSLLPALEVTRAHLAGLAALPVFCGLGAWMVTRRAITDQLRRAL